MFGLFDDELHGLLMLVRRVLILGEQSFDARTHASPHGFFDRPVQGGRGADRGHQFPSDCLEGVIAHFEDGRVVLDDGVVGDFSFAQTKLLGAFFVQSKAANL